MQLQVKESYKLLDQKERIYTELQGEIPILTERMRFLQKELDLSIENPQSTRDERIDNLLISKGFIESKIESLSNQMKMVELVEKLKSEISELTAKVKSLKLLPWKSLCREFSMLNTPRVSILANKPPCNCAK